MAGRRHGRHWPVEEQNANAFDGFGDLAGDPIAAAAVKAAWAAVLPPFTLATDPYRPEFDTTEGVRHG